MERAVLLGHKFKVFAHQSVFGHSVENKKTWTSLKSCDIETKMDAGQKQDTENVICFDIFNNDFDLLETDEFINSEGNIPSEINELLDNLQAEDQQNKNA